MAEPSPLDAAPAVPLRRDYFVAWQGPDSTARLYPVRPTGSGWASIRLPQVVDAHLMRAGFGFEATSYDLQSMVGSRTGPAALDAVVSETLAALVEDEAQRRAAS